MTVFCQLPLMNAYCMLDIAHCTAVYKPGKNIWDHGPLIIMDYIKILEHSLFPKPWKITQSYFNIFKFLYVYLKSRIMEGGRGGRAVVREILHALIHSWSGCISPTWSRPKLRAWNFLLQCCSAGSWFSLDRFEVASFKVLFQEMSLYIHLYDSTVIHTFILHSCHYCVASFVKSRGICKNGCFSYLFIIMIVYVFKILCQPLFHWQMNLKVILYCKQPEKQI